MAKVEISAVEIKRLWFTDTAKALVTKAADGKETPVTDIDGKVLKDIIEADGTVEVKNIHQDTWTLEESEASQDSYRNQLSGLVYRMSRKTPGELTVKFTIGQYDYAMKAAFLGGTATDTSWKRGNVIENIEKCFIALTDDDQYCVIPRAVVKANEANTDKAIGLAISATAIEPKDNGISLEYWFDNSEYGVAKSVANG